jgi:hypothetical protein
MANIIHEPGKFEGEHVSVPHYWNMALDSGADTDVWDCNDTQYSFFIFDADDRAKFPDITEYGFALYESDNGFVNAVWFDTKDEYDKAIAEIEADSDRDFDPEDE